MSKQGFTIFELLVVMAIISIALALVLGSYSSWATLHALDGAARTLEAGLMHARSIAKAQNTYVLIEYGTEGFTSNSVKQVSSYQSFVCTNTTDRSHIREVLDDCSGMDFMGANDTMGRGTLFHQQFIPLTLMPQRLSGSITLGYVSEQDTKVQEDTVIPVENGIIVFCPDGSVWSWNNRSAHTIVIASRKRFVSGKQQSQPLLMMRVLRVNLATGTVTAFRPEVL